MSGQRQVFTIYNEKQSTNLTPTAPPADPAVSAFTYSAPPPYSDGSPRRDQPPVPPGIPLVVHGVNDRQVIKAHDVESARGQQLAFDNKSVRAGFIRKVTKNQTVFSS